VAVEALVTAERLGEAERLARANLGVGVSSGTPSAQLRLTLSSLHLGAARPRDAVNDAETVLEQSDLPDDIHGSAEAALLMGLLADEDLARARRLAEAVLAGSDRPDSQLALATATMVLARVGWCEGRVASALGLARAAVRRADRFARGGFRLHPRLDLADMLIVLGEFDEAEVLLAECREEIELSGDTIYRPGPVIARASLRLAAGRLKEAQSDAEAGCSIAEHLGARRFVPGARQVLASIALFRGNVAAASAHIEGADEARQDGGEEMSSYGTYVAAQLLELRDGPVGCVEALASIYDDVSAHKQLLLEAPSSAAWLVRTSLAAGDRSRAEAVVAGAELLAADNRAFPSVVARAAQARGVLDRDVAALERAEVAHRHPWSRASAVEDAGTVLAEQGESVSAGECLQRALVAYGQIGSERDTVRVRAKLRRLGIRRRHWSQVERPAWGWASLTDTEKTVADLVAEGLTNPQVAARMYLSRHTVDFHLRQIFRKLSVSSRVELTRLALEGDNAPPSPA
jgi:DNA-binding CsgD family transcriptional regulator